MMGLFRLMSTSEQKSEELMDREMGEEKKTGAGVDAAPAGSGEVRLIPPWGAAADLPFAARRSYRIGADDGGPSLGMHQFFENKASLIIMRSGSAPSGLCRLFLAFLSNGFFFFFSKKPHFCQYSSRIDRYMDKNRMIPWVLEAADHPMAPLIGISFFFVSDHVEPSAAAVADGSVRDLEDCQRIPLTSVTGPENLAFNAGGASHYTSASPTTGCSGESGSLADG